MVDTVTEDVTILREERTQEMQKQIDSAWENRRIVTLDDKLGITEEEKESAYSLHNEIKSRQDEEIYELGEFTKRPDSVFCNNPHDYHQLLALACTKMMEDDISYHANSSLIKSESQFVQDFTLAVLREAHRDYYRKVASENLTHELSHGALGLGTEDLEIRYGVEFQQDRSTNRPILKPIILYNGKVEIGLLKKMLIAPTRLSTSDKIQSTGKP